MAYDIQQIPLAITLVNPDDDSTRRVPLLRYSGSIPNPDDANAPALAQLSPATGVYLSRLN